MNIPLITPLLSSLLGIIQSVVHNYGWSIVVLTVVVKVVLLPLDIKQRRSMQRIQEIQPEINKINERYKNDDQKRNQKTMELYQKYKVNPLSGCLPLLIQMPILFALFGALRQVAGSEALGMLESLRAGGEFVPQGWLWVKNVWLPDNFFNMNMLMPILSGLFNGTLFADATPYIQGIIPTTQYLATLGNAETQAAIVALLEDQTVITALENLQGNYAGIINGLFILPVAAASSQVFMSKMTQMGAAATPSAQGNSPAGGSQKIMMYLFPIMSLWICGTSNSVFAIYWLVSNLWGVGQYWLLDQLRKRNAQKAAGEVS